MRMTCIYYPKVTQLMLLHTYIEIHRANPETKRRITKVTNSHQIIIESDHENPYKCSHICKKYLAEFWHLAGSN